MTSGLRSSITAVVGLAFVTSVVLSAQNGPNEIRAREIFTQLVEINTPEADGNTTQAAEAMAGRFRGAAFPAGG